MKRNTSPTPYDIKRLEQALIKAALTRYKEWLKENGEPLPWIKSPNIYNAKKGWALIMATKALYEAINDK